MKKKLAFLFILLLAIIPLPNDYILAETIFQQVKFASSPNPVGSGARALGVGGAFIAIADDATAASWNPAGLIQLESSEFSIVGAYFSRQDGFFSTMDPEIANSGEVYEWNINYVSATFPFLLFRRNIVVSINYQRLYEFKRSFDYRLDFSSDGIDLLQYKNFKQSGYIGALGLASAVQINPYISLGATLNIWTDMLFWRNGWSDTFSEYSVGTQGRLPLTIDTLITDKYSHFRGVNFNLGFLWEINQHFTLGAVAKTPFKAYLRRECYFSQTRTLDTITKFNKTTLFEDIELHMPFSYGLGLALRISDALSLSLDLYRTEWSNYILKDGQGKEFSPIIGQSKDNSDVNATTQIRLGGEYLIIGRDLVVPLRCGLFYDPEPSPGSPEDFYGITVGSGLVYKRICFDAAYQFRWAQNVDSGNLIDGSRRDANHHYSLVSFIIHL